MRLNEKILCREGSLSDCSGRIREWQVWLVLLLYSFALLQIAGSDGWFRITPLKIDSAWFYICGKSWMSGLIPYRDFTDSKGPLLWLIYGLGYLITPHKFYGLFFIELIFYNLNFYVLYRAAHLLSRDKGVSMLTSMAMGVFFFYPGIHFQIKTEDFCLLFNSIIFYSAIKLIYRNEYSWKCLFLTGVSLGAFLLMKFAYFLTAGLPALVIIIYIGVKKRHLLLKSLGWMLGGFGLMVVPFCVSMLILGAFGDFVGEYFMKTGSTILNLKEGYDAHPDLKHRWPFRIFYLYRGSNYLNVYMQMVLIGFFFTLYLFRKSRWMETTLLLWYLGSVLLFSVVLAEHYFFMVSIFIFGGILMLAFLFGSLDLRETLVGGALILVIVTIVTTFNIYSEFYFSERDRKSSEEMEKVAYIINQREEQTGKRPTITFYQNSDRGEDIGTNAVAGTKYFAEQAGMTEEMERRHREDIFEMMPDFVVVKIEDEELGKRLEGAGYRMVREYVASENNPRHVNLLYERTIEGRREN